MSLEKMKKELEKDRVLMAKKEMQFKILERHEDIKRLEENIKNQDARIQELDRELKDMED